MWSARNGTDSGSKLLTSVIPAAVITGEIRLRSWLSESAIAFGFALTIWGVKASAPTFPPALATSEATLSVRPVMFRVMNPLTLSALTFSECSTLPLVLVTLATKGGWKPVTLAR